MSEMELDGKDLMILYFLQQESRMSLTELGKKLDMTPAAVSYRLNKLIDQQVIKKFSIELNHDLLTPNYQSFIVRLSLNNKYDLSEIISILFKTTYFDRILEVASSSSIIGITLPLSNSNLKDLSHTLNSLALQNFSIVPILKDHTVISSDIVGENISKIYCPLCQKSIKGEGIITKIGNKHLSFCCRECKDRFREKYDRITDTEVQNEN